MKKSAIETRDHSNEHSIRHWESERREDGDAGDGGAGVDDEVVPRDVLGGIVDEITDDGSQRRVSRARIPQRDSFLSHIFQPLPLHEPNSDLGLEQSGGYRVDPDLERPQLQGHHLSIKSQRPDISQDQQKFSNSRLLPLSNS